MTAPWMPCEVGKPLYQAYVHEAIAVLNRGYFVEDENQPMLVAWRAWAAHRDNCERCKVAK